MRTIFGYLFGCSHAHTTFPQARKDRTGKVIHPVRNYVACLDCGTELEHTLLNTDGPGIPERSKTSLLRNLLPKSARG